MSKLQLMANEPRPGSMAAADKKSNKNLAIGATVLNIILFVIIFFVVDKEWNKGSSLGFVVSALALIASTVAVWVGLANKFDWLTPNLVRAIWIGGIIVGFAAPRFI